MKGYNKLRKKALEILTTQLSDKLFYHGLHHTFDVLNALNRHIKREKIDAKKAKLLRIGALYHDIGFTVSNEEHEERGVEIAEKYMREYGCSKKEIETVKGLIRATKIPQTPKNELERIICDADLDYLGRDDFYEISNQLFRELKAFSIMNNQNDWNKAQIKFLELHKYHTVYGQNIRQPEKEKRIEQLKEMID